MYPSIYLSISLSLSRYLSIYLSIYLLFSAGDAMKAGGALLCFSLILSPPPPASYPGSLDQMLTESNKRSMCSTEQRITWLAQIASGMEFLHALQPQPMLHLDLRCANVLIDGAKMAKVADFGVARLGEAKSLGL